MKIDWPEALEIMVARTKHERLRELCHESYPDHLAYRRLIVEQAGGDPLPRPVPVVREQLTPSPARVGCCGGDSIMAMAPDEPPPTPS